MEDQNRPRCIQRQQTKRRLGRVKMADNPWTPAEMISLLEGLASSADRYQSSYTETGDLARLAAGMIAEMDAALWAALTVLANLEHPTSPLGSGLDFWHQGKPVGEILRAAVSFERAAAKDLQAP